MTTMKLARLILLLATLATPFRAAEALTFVNLSVRLTVGAAPGLVARGAHVGFVVSNSSGGADKPAPIRILVRASGPSAGVFGIATANGVELQLGGAGGAKVLATWKDARSQIVAAAASVGAFPYGTGSGDDAMIIEAPAGAFTAMVTAAQAGESVVEAYRLP
jgi:hypothetical protein